MTSVGRRLRESRVRQGLTMDEVQQGTKIRRRHLEALENDEPDPGVGRVYYRGFLRAYAAYLGLDPGPLLADFEPTAGEPEEPPVGRGRQPRRRRTPGTIILLLIMVTAAVLAGRYWFQGRTQPGGGDPLAPPAVVTPDPPVTTEPPPPPPPPDPEPVAPPRVTRDDPHPGRTNFRVHAAELELTLQVGTGPEDRCWVRVVADGEQVFEGTLESGSKATYRASRELVVRLGRPWVVTMVLNQNELGPAGPVGVVKDIHIATGP